MRLAGHSLLSGLLVLPECPQCADVAPSNPYSPRAGHGMCSCRAVSGHELTQAGRRKWHTEHKHALVRRAMP
jgi:hypothetical protein